MSKPQTFQCPNCGASLDSPGSADLTVRCPYCNSSVIVPEELREKQAAWDLSAFGLSSSDIEKLRELRRLIRTQQKGEAVNLYREMFGVTRKEAKDSIDRLSEGKPVQIANMTITGAEGLESAILALTSDALEQAQLIDAPVEETARLWGLSGLSIALLSVGCSIVTTLVIGAIVLLTTGITISQVLSAIAPQGTTGPAAMPVATPAPVSFALPVLTFGSEGTGPGLFTDARHVAVDGEGNIDVGEYSDGRVQVFDSLGQFISLWMIDAETPLRGLSADRRGIVYVVQRGEIFRHEGESGRLLGQVEYAEGWGFDERCGDCGRRVGGRVVQKPRRLSPL